MRTFIPGIILKFKDFTKVSPFGVTNGTLSNNIISLLITSPRYEKSKPEI